MKRVSLVVLLVTLTLGTTANAGAPDTMRVDYFHSGNNTTEMFSLDQVVVEPLPWTGNMSQPIDKTSRGKYLFEIVDPDNGDVAWSRSFSSIYGEWETIGESRRINRAFHESVRFPAQDSTFELVIKKRGAGNTSTRSGASNWTRRTCSYTASRPCSLSMLSLSTRAAIRPTRLTCC